MNHVFTKSRFLKYLQIIQLEFAQSIQKKLESIADGTIEANSVAANQESQDLAIITAAQTTGVAPKMPGNAIMRSQK